MQHWYDLELDNGVCITIKSYSHNREGLTKAFEDLEQVRGSILRADIISSRDGVIYTDKK